MKKKSREKAQAVIERGVVTNRRNGTLTLPLTKRFIDVCRRGKINQTKDSESPRSVFGETNYCVDREF